MDRSITRPRLECEGLDVETMTPRELACFVTGQHAAYLLIGFFVGIDNLRVDQIAAKTFENVPFGPGDHAALRGQVSVQLERLRCQSAHDRELNARRKERDRERQD